MNTQYVKRKICVVTGSRAEFGLLSPLMRELQCDPGLELQIVATGMHLSPEFGLTYRKIEEDGFKIAAKVESLLSCDTAIGISKSMGLGIIGFADAFRNLNPDLVVLLGDRYEIFAAAQAALISKIIIAHIHGGEVTEGAFDEAMRHGISKMAHIHFASEEPYRKRLIQLGESPGQVLNYGALGVENILNLKLLKRDKLEKKLGFEFAETTFLVTYHPVTLNQDGPEKQVGALLRALDRFSEAKVIFTKPNSDSAGGAIASMIDSYVKQNPSRAIAFTSMGQEGYLSAMKHSSVVIGNSSSGIIEAPAMGTPSVNLGDRQKGRIFQSTVIQCEEEESKISEAIRHALSVQKDGGAPLGGWIERHRHASKKMKDYLKNVELKGLLKKHFYDIDFKE